MPRLQHGMRPVVVIQTEDIAVDIPRGCRHLNEMERRTNWVFSPVVAAVIPHVLQRLEEGLTDVGFVEKDSAVVGDQSRMDGSGFRADTVTPEEQSGTDLVDGAGDDRRLRDRARPTVVPHDPAAQDGDVQRRGIVVFAEAAQRLRNGRKGASWCRLR